MKEIEGYVLIGKNILEVIVELSKQEWVYMDRFRGKCKAKIGDFLFVYFDEERRRDFRYYGLSHNHGLLLSDLDFINKEKEKGLGITSLARIKELKICEFDKIISTEDLVVHIPFIDIDLDKAGLKYDKESLGLVKKLIREHTQINEGVILKSSSKNNLHFIGMDRVMSRDDFITFLGLCLTMGYQKQGEKRYTNIADYRHIGHSLTPRSHLPELNLSKYDYTDIFATLRVNPKNSQDNYPEVIDVLQ